MIINNLDVDGFEEIHASVCFFYQFNDGDPYLLYGPKLKGFGAGYLMPPGGKRNDEDEKNPIKTAKREGKEEANFTGQNNMLVAELVVTILEKQQKLLIAVVLFTSWNEEDDQLKWNDEFEKLEFIPLSQIFNSKILPGDKEWMSQVMFYNTPVYVEMICGTCRENILNLEIRPLHKK